MTVNAAHDVWEPWGSTVPRRAALLAHGERGTRAAIGRALRLDGYDVTEAANGCHAVQQMAARMLGSGVAFDVALLHQRLRGWTGLQLLEGLRGSQWDAPIVFVVDAGDERTAHAARRRGADVVFEGPFDVDDLRTVVMNLVEPPPPSGGSGVYRTSRWRQS